MARRSGTAGVTVPGIREALADHCRAFGDYWDSSRFTVLADTLDRGDEITVSADTLAHALFELDPAAYRLAGQASRWRLAIGSDLLEPNDDAPLT